MRQAAAFIAAQSNSEPVWAPLLRAVLLPVHWWKRRRTVVRLIDLDDHILCDIGMCRDDIREINRLPLGVNAELILRQRAIRHAPQRLRGWVQS
jgi:uncharacterized protein YjiS (DUF1127 family)